ncbi:MAG TPA: UvrD-helicase domain-containing protein [Candidatus Kapabacteria bacterium]|nr:UvrD-helicase domain-containing protein [Candidatus Kapabacteria bacterium]
MIVREHVQESKGMVSFDDVVRTQLNPAQQEAVRSFEGPVLILAGAGSGKTRTLTYRLAALLAMQAARPDQIIALTFTNKAAREMRERIEQLVGKAAATRLWMGTFHSLFARILRIEAERLGYTKTFSIFDQEDSLRLIRELLVEQRMQMQQNTPQQIQSIISMQKNSLTLPDTFAARAATQLERLAAQIYPVYRQRLKKQNAMDFDDLLMNVVLLFQNQPDVLEKYQNKFRFVFVDEYQDTNHAQYAALKMLAAAHHNICVVGDDAQSIYAWRGADVRNILEFEKDYPDCRVVRLEQNYRSTKNILQCAQALIRQNHNQLEKELWTENDAGDKVAIIRCTDEVEEGYVIAQAIKEEIRKKKLSFKDCAVLYRTNAQSRSVEDALRNAHIPYTLVGGVAFYQRREIKDVLAYLRVVVNPYDDESLLRIVNVPGRGIGETTIGHIRTFAATEGLSVYDALLRIPEVTEIVPRSAESVRAFRAMLQRYVGLKDAISANELTRMIIDEVGFLRLLKEEATAEAMERRENIMELLSAIAQFCEDSPNATIEDF